MGKYFYEYLKIVFACFFFSCFFCEFLYHWRNIWIRYFVDKFWRKVRLEFRNLEKLFAGEIFFNISLILKIKFTGYIDVIHSLINILIKKLNNDKVRNICVIKYLFLDDSKSMNCQREFNEID